MKYYSFNIVSIEASIGCLLGSVREFRLESSWAKAPRLFSKFSKMRHYPDI